MNRSSTLLSGFSVLIGTFLLANGIWGLQSDVVFGVLSTNHTLSIIHIVLGAAAVITGIARAARAYCLCLGFVLLVVGILRFIPGTDRLVIDLFNVNKPAAFLDMAVGVVSLLLAFPTDEPLPVRHRARKKMVA